MSKASKYKKIFNKVNKILVVAKTALEDLSKSYLGHLREHKRVEVELQRLRSDIADGEDNVDCLRSQELDCKQKCLSAVRDRDVIRTHLAYLASGTLRLPLGSRLLLSLQHQPARYPGPRSPNFRSSVPARRILRDPEKNWLVTPLSKSAGKSLRFTGPVKFTTLYEFTGLPRISARSS